MKRKLYFLFVLLISLSMCTYFKLFCLRHRIVIDQVYYQGMLKPQDSFGIWQKIKRDYFFVNAWFYRSVWTINALFIVHSKLLSFSRNNPHIKMFGVPPNTLPYVMYIAIFSHLTLLHENMSFKTSAGRFISVFWRCAALSADQEKVFSFFTETILWL